MVAEVRGEHSGLLLGGFEVDARELGFAVPGIADVFPVDEVFAGVDGEAWEGFEGGCCAVVGVVDVDAAWI